MRYPLDRKSFYKNRDRKSRIPGPTVFFLLLIFLIILFLFSGFLGRFSLFAFGPFLKTQTVLSERFQSVSVFLTTQKKLSSENQSLKKEIENLNELIISFTQDKNELDFLREVYSREDDRLVKTVGSIVSNPKHLVTNTVIIDIGKKSGLVLGDQVFAQGFVLGEVVLLSSSMSKVKFYSSPNTELAVRIGDDFIPAMASGKGLGNFTIRLPRGISINKDDFVYRPSGELLGLVGEIEESAEEPFQTIFVSVPINLNQLKWLTVYE